MSLAATDHRVHHVATATVVEATEEVAVGLPEPTTSVSASVVAFALAGPGAMAMASLLVIALMQIAQGGSMSLWALGVSVAFALYIPAFLISLWAASARDEWGR